MTEKPISVRRVRSEGERPTVKRRKLNEGEYAFRDFAIEQGFSYSKRGWPDFFCTDKNGNIFVVEVKPTARRNLKPEQLTVLKALSAAGIPAFRWSPDHAELEPVQ
jgi:hypothetical protein